MTAKESDILHKVTRRITELPVRSGEDVKALFAELRALFDREIGGAADAEAIEATRVRWLGRKRGLVNQAKDNWLLHAKPELKREVGKQLNEFRDYAERKIEEKRKGTLIVHGVAQATAGSSASAVAEVIRAEERVDWTLPGKAGRRGARHLITQTIEEICDIFVRLGYSVVEGPEMETPYYNFEALNIPEFHPARDTMDTLYLANDLLLRTHTSPMQVRTMEKQPPPVRIVVPGKVYRRDNPDATHSFMFHQVEGLAVDTDITFCDFKGTIEHLLREFFGPEMKTRLRPSYFPFTEPSAEVDGSCMVCAGVGCRVCKYVGWIELFGAGMVDPAVYGFVGYDATKLSGFAFGIGVERFAMLKYGMDDLQLFFQNDVRFLRQFER